MPTEAHLESFGLSRKGLSQKRTPLELAATKVRELAIVDSAVDFTMSKAEKQAARAAKRIQRAKEKAARERAAATAVRARHILVKHVGSRTPLSRRTLMPISITKEEAHAELERLLDILDNEPDDFASIEAKFIELATERSDCDTYSKGGDVGVFGEGQMQQAFFTEVYELDVGELSTVFDTGSGSHIVLRIPIE